MKIGFARIDLTPPVRTALGGYAARKGVSKGVHDSLYAKVMVINDGTEHVAIVACDLVGVPHELVIKAKSLATQETPIPPDNILICATHTHSGPAIPTFVKQGTEQELIHIMAKKIAGAIYMAWDRRTKAKVGIGKGEICGLGVNRRNTNGQPIDPEVGVIKVESCENGNLIGAIANYTCHPVVLGPNNLLISADYPGYATKFVEKVEGNDPVIIFTNGAEGDVNTGHSADESAIGVNIPGRTFARAKRLGTMLGAEITKVLQTTETTSQLKLHSEITPIALQLKDLPSPDEAKRQVMEKEEVIKDLREKNAPTEKINEAKIAKVYADITLSHVQEAQTVNGMEIKTKIQAISINDSVLIGVPGELFVEIGLDIKRKSSFKNTFIVGLANDYLGYIPTKKAFEEGGYEAITTRFSSEAGELVRDTALNLIENIKDTRNE